MIAKLTGVVDSTGEDWVVIDVGGVGYLVYCSGRTLPRLGGRGEAASLFIETHVREDHIHLYGFADAVERDWFCLLLTVQGVGAKVALSILTVLGTEELAFTIAAQDGATIGRASGVGPKLAARILNELRDKTGGVNLGAGAVMGEDAREGTPSESAAAVSALVNLGFRRTEAFTAVSQAARRLGAKTPVESLIPEALKELAS